ncbi:MAG: DUF21 domain-containing protein, partial [Myxococcales bacterium]|nr:DUF21 domain-containing protein [Myxococcales bacterium]
MDLPSIGFAAIVVGVGVAALFAALDASFVGLGAVRLEALREAGGPWAASADRLTRDLDAVRARLLAGRAICIAAATVIAWSAGEQLGPGWLRYLAAGAVALLYGVLAEVSTTLGQHMSAEWSVRMMRWIRPVELVLAPLAWPLEVVGREARKRIPEHEEPTEATERIATLTVEKVIEDGEESGDIDEAQAELLRSVLEFKDTVAREVMVPRTRMVAFSLDSTVRDVLEKIAVEGHSRYPVYRDTL